jgi:putative NADH-flavin reductase
MIVITTPTGRIGHQILDNVRDRAEAIRVIARDPSRLSLRERERVEVVLGSHDNIDVVTQAFAGADCVFWLVPPTRHAKSPEDYYLDFTCPACEAIKSYGASKQMSKGYFHPLSCHRVTWRFDPHYQLTTPLCGGSRISQWPGS